MLQAGTVVAERFRLIRPLGEGAMGAVWLAQHTQLDVPCALKFILGEGASSADLRARFEREAKAAAVLRSPHVVGILDHGVWNGTPYIAMEYLEGEDLSARLHRLGRLPPKDVVDVVIQVARALAKAHAAGLVHRDLKPANIFLAKDDDREIAKVLDFGIAKQSAVGIKDAGTKTGALMGTPYYMSPEQVQGTRALDHRSDLWSLAIVVYQCLTGQLPFESEALGDLLMKIMVNAPPIPSRVAAVPPGFDAWWARAAARDPGARFQGAKEMAEALALALGVSMGGVGVGTTSSGAYPASAASSRPGAGTIGMGAFAQSPAYPHAASPGAGQHPLGASPTHPAFAQSPGAAATGATLAAPAPWSGSLVATSGTLLHPGAAPGAPSLSPRPKRRAPIAAVVGSVLLLGVVALVAWAARPAPVADAPASTASAEPTGRAPAAASPSPSPSENPSPSQNPSPSPSPSQGQSPSQSQSPSAEPSASASVAPRPQGVGYPRAIPRPAQPAPKPSATPNKDLVRW